MLVLWLHVVAVAGRKWDFYLSSWSYTQTHEPFASTLRRAVHAGALDPGAMWTASDWLRADASSPTGESAWQNLILACGNATVYANLSATILARTGRAPPVIWFWDGWIAAAGNATALGESFAAFAQSYAALRAAMEPPTSVAFADLASAPDGCHRIPDTARRGITPAQLRAIVAHVARRLGFAFTEPADDDGIGKWERSGRGERWLGARAVDGKFLYAALGLHDVNLYDCCR